MSHGNVSERVLVGNHPGSVDSSPINETGFKATFFRDKALFSARISNSSA